MPALDVLRLEKAFGATQALKQVDFAVQAGSVHALLGSNGSGKSTLIKVLAGYHQPDAGAVLVNGERLQFGSPSSAHAAGCRFVHQDLGLVNTSSVLDNLSLGVGYPTRLGTVRRRVAEAQARAVLAVVNLDLDLSDQVGQLAPAVRTGVAVARGLRDDGNPVRLLVLDEPTSALPLSETESLLELVRGVARSGVGVLFVTHRLDEVYEIADTVTVLRDGQVVAQQAPGELSRSELVELLVGDELKKVRAAAAQIGVHVDREPVLRVHQLATDGVEGLDLEVRPGEIVGLAGLVGSGHAAVLPAIFGAIDRTSGTVAVGDRVVRGSRPDRAVAGGIAYVPSDRRGLGGVMSSTARENVTLSTVGRYWRAPRQRIGEERATTAAWFDELGVVPRDGVEHQLETFSGGNQQKVVLARALATDPVVLLLDEPTQGIDVGAKEQLHRQLVKAASAGTAIVLSSSDTDELATLCERVLVFRDAQLVGELRAPHLSVRAIVSASLGTSKDAA